jgi:hypothetical protein
LDFFIGTLCMCIGTAVAWLVAFYTKDGARLLLWNTLFAMAGAALCALVLARAAPAFLVVGLVIAGPFCSLLMIYAGTAARRALWAGGN